VFIVLTNISAVPKLMEVELDCATTEFPAVSLEASPPAVFFFFFLYNKHTLNY